MKKELLMAALMVLALFMAGCGNNWYAERKPETSEERAAVAQHEKILISNIPAQLSGHDQDWDDAIREAHRIAIETFCKTRLYEYTPGGYPTGRIKEVDNSSKDK